LGRHTDERRNLLQALEGSRKREAQAQSFITDFMCVFGAGSPEAMGDFEFRVPLSDGRTD